MEPCNLAAKEKVPCTIVAMVEFGFLKLDWYDRTINQDALSTGP